jgi:hypothetical protein
VSRLNYASTNKAAGLCRTCPRPLFRGGYCETHYRASAERSKARYRETHPAKRRRGRQMKCGQCGELGHNARGHRAERPTYPDGGHRDERRPAGEF